MTLPAISSSATEPEKFSTTGLGLPGGSHSMQVRSGAVTATLYSTGFGSDWYQRQPSTDAAITARAVPAIQPLRRGLDLTCSRARSVAATTRRGQSGGDHCRSPTTERDHLLSQSMCMANPVERGMAWNPTPLRWCLQQNSGRQPQSVLAVLCRFFC